MDWDRCCGDDEGMGTNAVGTGSEFVMGHDADKPLSL